MREFLTHTKDLLLRGGAAVGGFLHGLSAGNHGAAVLLVVLMIADYLSGVAAAAMGKSSKSESGRLSSAAGLKGLWRKALMLVVVAVAYGLDWFANEGNAMFSTAAIFFYISNEGLSLLENLALCGVPVPKRLRGLLERLPQDEAESPQGAQTQADANAGAPPQNG